MQKFTQENTIRYTSISYMWAKTSKKHTHTHLKFDYTRLGSLVLLHTTSDNQVT
jgi:hypothetical protein